VIDDKRWKATFPFIHSIISDKIIPGDEKEIIERLAIIPGYCSQYLDQTNLTLETAPLL
jgi:hypothetical protein